MYILNVYLTIEENYNQIRLDIAESKKELVNSSNRSHSERRLFDKQVSKMYDEIERIVNP